MIDIEDGLRCGRCGGLEVAGGWGGEGEDPVCPSHTHRGCSGGGGGDRDTSQLWLGWHLPDGGREGRYRGSARFGCARWPGLLAGASWQTGVAHQYMPGSYLRPRGSSRCWQLAARWRGMMGAYRGRRCVAGYRPVGRAHPGGRADIAADSSLSAKGGRDNGGARG